MFFDAKLKLGWAAFNNDLKKEAERVWAGKQGSAK
jgi:hypothetical protein